MPDVVNTSGVKVPRSTSFTLLLYCRFFSLSLEWSCLSTSDRDSRDALGSVTQTSKKAFCCLNQNPQARMSSLASWFLLTLRLLFMCSLSSASSVGSTSTSGTTSRSMSARRSLTWLCLAWGYPPHGHVKACAVVISCPHAHWGGRPSRAFPYRMHSASRKSHLLSTVPCCVVGAVERQKRNQLSLAAGDGKEGHLVGFGLDLGKLLVSPVHSLLAATCTTLTASKRGSGGSAGTCA